MKKKKQIKQDESKEKQTTHKKNIPKFSLSIQCVFLRRS